MISTPPAMELPPASLFRPATPFFSLPQFVSSRPFSDQRSRLEVTPSRVDLLKSPPSFTELNQQSKAYFLEYAFSF